MPEVVVYDAVGRKMETGFAGGAPAYHFEVPASGVYLVKSAVMALFLVLLLLLEIN